MDGLVKFYILRQTKMFHKIMKKKYERITSNLIGEIYK
jgi:hypothetical protein